MEANGLWPGRIKLTSGSHVIETLNQQWAQQYLGQRGLGSRYLIEEVEADVDPLSPENKLIFATGPLTGTPANGYTG